MAQTNNMYQPTKLVLYRQYNTYQVMLEAYQQNDLSVDDGFNKIILYIMEWVRTRLGEEAINMPEAQFLREQYPPHEEYANFRVSSDCDINPLSVADVRTSYIAKDDAWFLRVIELGNNDKPRRTFTTNVCVYKKEKSVLLGIRIKCREPRDNENDEEAIPFRPAFVKTISEDDGFNLCEAGVSSRYTNGKPILLNGKSGPDTEDLYNNLVNNPSRQLPIVFVPEEPYYIEGNPEAYSKEEGKEDRKIVDGISKSYLGFAHVVVVQKSLNKLCEMLMNDGELKWGLDNHNIVIYRRNEARGKESFSCFYELNNEDKYKEIDDQIKIREPLRRNYQFGNYNLEAYHWDPDKVLELIAQGGMSDSDEMKLQRAENACLRREIEEKNNDLEELQNKINDLSPKVEKCKKLEAQFAGFERRDQEVRDQEKELDKERKSLHSELDGLINEYKIKLDNVRNDVQKQYEPLFKMPDFGTLNMKEIREGILKWIDTYYSDVIFVDDRARKSLEKNKQNLYWRDFCLMFHYLAGYTLYRNNDEGPAINADAARDYDIENRNITCESSGKEAMKMYPKEYSIEIDRQDGKEIVKLDMHIKKGKGMDADSVRIYFYYDSESKKSIVGEMPEHLPDVNNKT